MKLFIQGFLLIVVIGAISTSICLWVVPQNPELVIVDIQTVYTELGEDIEFQKQMRRQESRLRQNFESLRTELAASLALRKKQLGDSPSEEDKQLFEAIKKDMQKQIDQRSAKLRLEIQSYKEKTAERNAQESEARRQSDCHETRSKCDTTCKSRPFTLL